MRLSRHFRRVPSSIRSSFSAPLIPTTVLLVAFPFAVRMQLLRVRELDPDELAHLHGAWSIWQGLLPYRDFFEHHTPGLHFLLAPFFSLFNVETRVDDAVAFLTFARRCMWIASALLIMSLFLLARLWRGWRVACIATVLLAQTPVFIGKTTDVRPDVVSTLLFIAALGYTVAGLRTDRPARAGGWLFGAGFLLGVGVLFTQKLVFVFPGFAAAIVWRSGRHTPRATSPWRAHLLGVHCAGAAAPLLLLIVYLWLHDALHPFLTYGVAWNVVWRERFWPFEFPLTIASGDPLLVSAAVAGFARAARSLGREGSVDRADALLLFTALSAGGGLFLLPVAYLQYYLVLLPLGALFAASFLVQWIDGHLDLHARERSLALILVAASLYPSVQLVRGFSATNADQLAAIRFVLENTRPSDTVFDEYSGYGVFRPHAYFFWFLHGEVRAMLEEEDFARLLDDLRRGRIRPELVAVSGNIRDRSTEWRTFLERNYEPTSVEAIWKRRSEARSLRGPSGLEGDGGPHRGERLENLRSRDSRTR